MDFTAQKGFYDTKRQFQGKDDRPAPIDQGSGQGSGQRSDASAPPRSQLVAGALFLLVIGALFLKFAWLDRPKVEPTAGAKVAAPAAPAKAAH